MAELAVRLTLHLLLSLFLCSMRVPVWLIRVAAGGERRATIAHQRTGRVLPGNQQFTDVQMAVIPNWVALQAFSQEGL
jgi:hypothetical protein